MIHDHSISVLGNVCDQCCACNIVNGEFTSFDPPRTGPLGSDAAGINPSGVIVGLYFDTSGTLHGYIRTL